MRQLSWVQFFLVWSFEWVFTTPAIAHHIYGLPISDSKSEAYQNAGD
jgi:maltose/moltooligosaccharide transporter